MAGNVTGWSELMDLNIGGAFYSAVNESLLGNAMLGLFIIIVAALYIKTKSPVVPLIVGIIMYGCFFSWFTTWGLGISSVVLVFLMGSVLYSVVWSGGGS